MTLISSAKNTRVRQIKALQTKARLRRSEGLIALEGARLIADALRYGGKPTVALYAPDRADYALIAALQGAGCELLPCRGDVLGQISETQGTPGILAVFRLPKPRIPAHVRRVLILDAIREPGNLGAILRAANAAGVDLAILAPECVDPYNNKALRAGAAAHFRLPIVEAGWREIGAYCQDLLVAGASADGDVAYTAVDWRGEWALIIGNEARGLSDRGRELAEALVAIPMAGGVESLNAASAAAVLLFEARRQRNHN